MRVRRQAFLWLMAARRDLERAESSLREDDRAATVFWSQQAAEKALKGFSSQSRVTTRRPIVYGGS